MSSDLVPAYDGDYQVVQLDDRMQVEDQNPGLQVPTEQKVSLFLIVRCINNMVGKTICVRRLCGNAQPQTFI